MASPWIGLLLIASVCGVLAWFVQRVTASTSTRRLADRRRACFMELWLYRHDPFLGLKLCREALVTSMRLLGASWKAVCLLMPVFAFVWVGLDAWLSQRPLRAGEKTVLTVLAAPSLPDAMPEPNLSVSDNLSVETQALHVPEKGELSWRIGVLGTGPARAEMQAGDDRAALEIVLGKPPRRIPPGGSSERQTRFSMHVAYPVCRMMLGTRIIRWEWVFLGMACLAYAFCSLCIGRNLREQVET